MKKFLPLLLLIPLTAISAEHSGKAMQKKTQTQQTSEHGGKAMESKDSQSSSTAAEHDGQPMQKRSSEHAGTPVK